MRHRKPYVRRVWSAAECAELRRLYREEPTAELAARLGRPVGQVHRKAVHLGISARVPHWRPELDAELARLNAAGESDAAIGRVLGYSRHCVGRHRRRLGLPDRSSGPQARRAVSEGVRRQLGRLGLPSLAALRLDTWRRQAVARGWPETINGHPISPRYVQILDALYEHGPQTKRQLAERIGWGWKGSRRTLASNGGGGSYLAELIRDGLVVNLGRCVYQGGKGRNSCLYALDMSVERVPRGGHDERDHS